MRLTYVVQRYQISADTFNVHVHVQLLLPVRSVLRPITMTRRRGLTLSNDRRGMYETDLGL